MSSNHMDYWKSTDPAFLDPKADKLRPGSDALKQTLRELFQMAEKLADEGEDTREDAVRTAAQADGIKFACHTILGALVRERLLK